MVEERERECEKKSRILASDDPAISIGNGGNKRNPTRIVMRHQIIDDLPAPMAMTIIPKKPDQTSRIWWFVYYVLRTTIVCSVSTASYVACAGFCPAEGVAHLGEACRKKEIIIALPNHGATFIGRLSQRSLVRPRFGSSRIGIFLGFQW